MDEKTANDERHPAENVCTGSTEGNGLPEDDDEAYTVLLCNLILQPRIPDNEIAVVQLWCWEMVSGGLDQAFRILSHFRSELGKVELSEAIDRIFVARCFDFGKAAMTEAELDGAKKETARDRKKLDKRIVRYGADGLRRACDASAAEFGKNDPKLTLIDGYRVGAECAERWIAKRKNYIGMLVKLTTPGTNSSLPRERTAPGPWHIRTPPDTHVTPQPPV